MQRFKTILGKLAKAIFRPRELAIVVVAFMIIGLLRYVTFHFDAFNPVAHATKGFSTTDIFYDMMLASPADTSSSIVIVDMTQLHSRDSIASVLEEIDELKPAAIDIDVVFEHPKELEGDLHLMGMAATISNAVFSFKMMDPDLERMEFTRQAHSFFAKDLELNEGFVNVDRNITRDIPLCLEMQGTPYPSVIVKMLEIIQGQPFDYVNHRSHPINYEPTVFRIIPYDSIQYYKDYISGHIVMFGGAHEGEDLLYTPLGQMHGINVLCYALKTMLEMKQEKKCTGTLYWILTLVLSYIGACLIMSYKDWTAGMKEGFVSDMLRTIFVTSIVVFIFMSVFMTIFFVLFVTWRINFDLTPTLAVMALTTTAADIVRISKKHLQNLRKGKNGG